MNLRSAQRAVAALLMTRTLRTTQRTPVATERCGIAAPLRGEIAAADGVREGRGRYRLTLPATTTLELRPEEEIAIVELPGRLFRVVWTPPPGNLLLSRVYGIDEVGR